MCHRRSAIAVLALACVVATSSAPVRTAFAQDIERIEPSARAGGMGGASVAVGWSGPASAWLNPALAATSAGFTVKSSVQQLVPGLAGDLRMRASSFSVCYAGIALSSSGRPFGGETLVEPLQDVAVDPSGGLFYQSGVMESLESNTAAVSLGGLADAVLGLFGNGRTRLSDWADAGWGRSWKHMEASNGAYAGSLPARDEGWYARVAPWDSRRGREAPGGGTRLELGWGHAVAGDETGGATFWGIPLPKQERDGAAAHFTWWGPDRSGAPGAAWADPFRGALAPLLDVTLAWDHEREVPAATVGRRPDPAFTSPPWTVEHYGMEATFARVLTGRVGYVDDRTGDVRQATWGVGLCVPVRREGEVRYDFASWPQAYPRRVYRHELSLRLDPFARWFGARRPNGG